MKKLLFLLCILALTFSCSADDTSTPVAPPAPVAKYTITLSAGEGGTVSTTGGEYEAGQTVSVTATPQGEYVFTSWSDGNTNATRTITVSSNSTLTANFEKRKYPLTLNIEGEGEVLEEIVNAGRTTDYDSGTTVKLTAAPAEGWEFAGWTGAIESEELEVQLLVSEAKEINAEFKEIELASLVLDVKSKMFTKGVADTLLIPINIPGGFKAIKVDSQDGLISITSKPFEGDLEGEIVVNYTNQKVNNVDWDRSIAGYDKISFEIEDLLGNISNIEYKLRTQPEPTFKNYAVSSSINYRGSNSRIKLNNTLLKHLNRRGDLSNLCIDTSEYVFNDERFKYFNDDIEIEDDKFYFNTNWNPFENKVNAFEQGSHLNYLDINGDGYEDVLLIRVGSTQNCYSCLSRPLEFFLYEDGKYVYSEINIYGEVANPQFFNEGMISIADFDNDQDPDIIIGGQVDAKGGKENESETVFFENKYNEGLGFKTTSFSNNDLIEFSVMSTVDINMDGFQDIYSAANWKPAFIINKGGLEFERIDRSNGLENIFNFNSSELNFEDNSMLNQILVSSYNYNIFEDINNDGIIDHFLGMPNGFFKEKFDNNEISESLYNYLKDYSTIRVHLGEIKSIGLNNSNNLRFKTENILNIPDVKDFPYIISSTVKDIDNDKLNELIIVRASLNSQKSPAGHYIQILEITGKQVIDITSSVIENNFSYGNEASINDFCVEHDIFWNTLRADDINGDGNVELFSDSFAYPNDSGGMKFHLWEWNGSKFIKTKPEN